VPNPFFGIVPRSSSLGDPTITVAQLIKPYPMYTTVSQYRNNVGAPSPLRPRSPSAQVRGTPFAVLAIAIWIWR
jgi:hypothetical protein